MFDCVFPQLVQKWQMSIKALQDAALSVTKMGLHYMCWDLEYGDILEMVVSYSDYQ